MTDTTPDPGPGSGDDPWHIQWLRAQRDAAGATVTSTTGDAEAPTESVEAEPTPVEAVVPATSDEPLATANGFQPSAASLRRGAPVAPVASVAPAGPSGRRRRRVTGLVVGVLALAAAGLAIGLTRNRSRNNNAATESSSAPTAIAATTTVESSSASPTTVLTSTAVATTVTITATTATTTTATTPKTSAATITPASTATSAVPTTTSAPAANVLDATPTERLPGGQLWPRGLYVFPKFLMQGTVPNQQVADAIGAKIGAIIGPENIVDQTIKDPTVPLVKTVIVRIGPSIIFDTDSDVIRAESVEGWNQWGLFLKANPAVTVTIIGHTDSRGTPEHNADLAKRRAESAKARMVEVGVDPSRITTVGKGADDPIGDNSTVDGMQQNRRIEVAVNNALG